MSMGNLGGTACLIDHFSRIIREKVRLSEQRDRSTVSHGTRAAKSHSRRRFPRFTVSKRF